MTDEPNDAAAPDAPEAEAAAEEPKVDRTLMLTFYDNGNISFATVPDTVNKAEIIGLLIVAARRLGG